MQKRLLSKLTAICLKNSKLSSVPPRLVRANSAFEKAKKKYNK